MRKNAILSQFIEMLEHNEPITDDVIIALKCYNEVIPQERSKCESVRPTEKSKLLMDVLEVIPYDTPLRIMDIQNQFFPQYTNRRLSAKLKKLYTAGLVERVTIGNCSIPFGSKIYKKDIIGFKRIK